MTPISDARITIPRERRKVYKTISLIVQELSYQQSIETGEPDAMKLPPNSNFESLIGGIDVPASELLTQAASTGGRSISWILRWYGGQDGQTASALLEFTPSLAFVGKILTGRSPLLTYDNSRYGLSLEYRRGYVLSKRAEGEYAVWSGGTDPNWVGLVTINIPRNSYIDSSLVSALVSIGVNQHITLEGCEGLISNAEPETRTVRFSGPRFFKVGRPAAALRAAEFHQERVTTVAFQNGICYEIYVETRNGTPDVYEMGGVALEVDYDDLQRRLQAIVSTVRIRPPQPANRSQRQRTVHP